MAVRTGTGGGTVGGGRANDPQFIVGTVGFVRGPGGQDSSGERDDGVFDPNGVAGYLDDRTSAANLRDAFFNTHAELLSEYENNKTLVIELHYGSNSVYQRRDSAGNWEDVDGVIKGERGVQGYQGRYFVFAYQNSRTQRPVPTDGVYNVTTDTWTTLPTNWTAAPTTRDEGEITFRAYFEVDPSQDSGDVDVSSRWIDVRADQGVQGDYELWIFTKTLDTDPRPDTVTAGVTHNPTTKTTNISAAVSANGWQTEPYSDLADNEVGWASFAHINPLIERTDYEPPFNDPFKYNLNFKSAEEFAADIGEHIVDAGADAPDNSNADTKFTQLYVQTSTPLRLWASVVGEDSWTRYVFHDTSGGGTGTGNVDLAEQFSVNGQDNWHSNREAADEWVRFQIHGNSEWTAAIPLEGGTGQDSLGIYTQFQISPFNLTNVDAVTVVFEDGDAFAGHGLDWTDFWNAIATGDVNATIKIATTATVADSVAGTVRASIRNQNGEQAFDTHDFPATVDNAHVLEVEYEVTSADTELSYRVENTAGSFALQNKYAEIVITPSVSLLSEEKGAAVYRKYLIGNDGNRSVSRNDYVNESSSGANALANSYDWDSFWAAVESGEFIGKVVLSGSAELDGSDGGDFDVTFFTQNDQSRTREVITFVDDDTSTKDFSLALEFDSDEGYVEYSLITDTNISGVELTDVSIEAWLEPTEVGRGGETFEGTVDIGSISGVGVGTTVDFDDDDSRVGDQINWAAFYNDLQFPNVIGEITVSADFEFVSGILPGDTSADVLMRITYDDNNGNSQTLGEETGAVTDTTDTSLSVSGEIPNGASNIQVEFVATGRANVSNAVGEVALSAGALGADALLERERFLEFTDETLTLDWSDDSAADAYDRSPHRISYGGLSRYFSFNGVTGRHTWTGREVTFKANSGSGATTLSITTVGTSAVTLDNARVILRIFDSNGTRETVPLSGTQNGIDLAPGAAGVQIRFIADLTRDVTIRNGEFIGISFTGTAPDIDDIRASIDPSDQNDMTFRMDAEVRRTDPKELQLRNEKLVLVDQAGNEEPAVTETGIPDATPDDEGKAVVVDPDGNYEVDYPERAFSIFEYRNARVTEDLVAQLSFAPHVSNAFYETDDLIDGIDFAIPNYIEYRSATRDYLVTTSDFGMSMGSASQVRIWIQNRNTDAVHLGTVSMQIQKNDETPVTIFSHDFDLDANGNDSTYIRPATFSGFSEIEFNENDTFRFLWDFDATATDAQLDNLRVTILDLEDSYDVEYGGHVEASEHRRLFIKDDIVYLREADGTEYPLFDHERFYGDLDAAAGSNYRFIYRGRNSDQGIATPSGGTYAVDTETFTPPSDFHTDPSDVTSGSHYDIYFAVLRGEDQIGYLYVGRTPRELGRLVHEKLVDGTRIQLDYDGSDDELTVSVDDLTNNELNTLTGTPVPGHHTDPFRQERNINATEYFEDGEKHYIADGVFWDDNLEAVDPLGELQDASFAVNEYQRYVNQVTAIARNNGNYYVASSQDQLIRKFSTVDQDGFGTAQNMGNYIVGLTIGASDEDELFYLLAQSGAGNHDMIIGNAAVSDVSETDTFTLHETFTLQHTALNAFLARHGFEQNAFTYDQNGDQGFSSISRLGNYLYCMTNFAASAHSGTQRRHTVIFRINLGGTAHAGRTFELDDDFIHDLGFGPYTNFAEAFGSTTSNPDGYWTGDGSTLKRYIHNAKPELFGGLEGTPSAQDALDANVGQTLVLNDTNDGATFGPKPIEVSVWRGHGQSGRYNATTLTPDVGARKILEFNEVPVNSIRGGSDHNFIVTGALPSFISTHYDNHSSEPIGSRELLELDAGEYDLQLELYVQSIPAGNVTREFYVDILWIRDGVDLVIDEDVQERTENIDVGRVDVKLSMNHKGLELDTTSYFIFRFSATRESGTWSHIVGYNLTVTKY